MSAFRIRIYPNHQTNCIVDDGSRVVAYQIPAAWARFCCLAARVPFALFKGDMTLLETR